MDYFRYSNGHLHAEKVPLQKIAKEVGTPFYCYSSSMIKNNFTEFARAVSVLGAESVPSGSQFTVQKVSTPLSTF